MATRNKEIKVQITAENKGLFSAINSAVSGIKKFATEVTGIKNTKIGTDIKAELAAVEVQAKKTAVAIKKIGESQVQKPVRVVNVDTSTRTITSSKVDGAVRTEALGSGATGVKVSAQAFRDAAAAAKGAGDAAKGAGNEGARAGEKVRTGARRSAAALKEAQESASEFGQTLANVTVIAYGVFAVLERVKNVLTKAISPGVAFTKQMESARVGVAGILLSMTNVHGRQLQLNEALAISEQTFNTLLQQSLRFNLNINDTAAAFQTIIGPGLAAQMTLEELVQFAVQGTKAVKSFGLDSMQVVQELRSMVSGDIDQNSQVAKAMGITPAGVAEAKQTAGGLFKYLNDKLKGFTLAAGEIPKTITGKTDMLAAALSLVSEAGFKPLVNTAKGVFDKIIGYLTVTKTETDEFGKTIKTVEVNPELVETLNDVSDYLIKTTKDVITFGKATLSFLSPAVPVLKFIGQHVVIIGAGFGTWIIAGTVITVIKGVGTALVVVEGVLKTGTRAWRAYNLAIALGSTNMKAFSIATRTANASLGIFRITVRSILASTGIGLLAVGVGYLAEKMLNLADNTDKVADAKDRLTQGGSIGGIGTLGNLSAAHEGKTIDRVSSGENDPYGGVSYGTWQLSSKQGSVSSFIKWLIEQGYEAGPFLAKSDPVYEMGMAYDGHDLIPGTPEFTQRWHDAVNKYGASFEKAYAQYFKENYYDNFTKNLEQDFGFDANKRSDAVRQVLWSTSVQHGTGGAYKIMKDAANLAGVPNISWLTDEQLISYIYQARKNAFPQDINRYTEEQQQAMDLLSANPQSGVNASDLELIDPAQTAKDLKEAELKYLKAQREGVVQAYIADLEKKEQDLQQRYTVGEIGDDQFFTDLRTILTDKIYAQIGELEQQIKDQSEVLTNKNYSAADKKNAETEILGLNNEIKAKRAELEKALNANTFEFQQAVLESMDRALDAQIEAFTAQGKLEEAARLEQQKSDNIRKMAKLKANKAETAIKALELTNAANLIDAQVSEATSNISYATEDMQLAQGKMIQSVVNGTISVADSVKQFQADFDAKTKVNIEKLNAMLTEAKNLGLTAKAREIENKLREIKGTAADFVTDLLQAIDDDLQAKIDAINADNGLTPLQKDDLIKAAERVAAAKRADAYGLQAEIFIGQGSKDADQLAGKARAQKDLNDETKKYKTILQEVEKAARDAFEDGLVTFLTDGITQCENLADAVRNLAITVLSAIQRIYAEQLAKNIMSLWSSGQNNSRPTVNGVTVQGPLKPDGSFAEGGSFIDSFGVVHGPGTSTSDSILAYAQKYGRIINISNSEGILTGAAVRNIGHRALAALNDGVDPRKIFKNYATGGMLSSTSVSDIPGPQDIAANLTAGDTNVHLKNVNLFDKEEIVGGYMQSRSGERVLLNFCHRNSAVLNKILKVRP